MSKVKLLTKVEVFQPIKLEVTITTQKEFDELRKFANNEGCFVERYGDIMEELTELILAIGECVAGAKTGAKSIE